MSLHTGFGTIVYDPFRGEMQRRTNGWCVVEVDKEITRYFRHLMAFDQHIHLQPPAWDAHISVVRGERIDRSVEQLWKKFHKQRVEFQYHHVGEFRTGRSRLGGAEDNGTYYWVDVECPTLDLIRAELKLPRGWKFHLTFGRTYEYEARKPKR